MGNCKSKELAGHCGLRGHAKEQGHDSDAIEIIKKSVPSSSIGKRKAGLVYSSQRSIG